MGLFVEYACFHHHPVVQNPLRTTKQPASPLIHLSFAVIAGAEIFGPSTVMPSTSGGLWYTTAQKTYDQVWEDWDDQCGGGIYWVRQDLLVCTERIVTDAGTLQSRDRGSSAGRYKSTITNVEFIAQGARNYLQMKFAPLSPTPGTSLTFFAGTKLSLHSLSRRPTGFSASQDSRTSRRG